MLLNRHGLFYQGGKNHIQLPQNDLLQTGLHLLAGEDAAELLPTPFLQEESLTLAEGTKVLCMERALDVSSSHRATMGLGCEVLRGTVLPEPREGKLFWMVFHACYSAGVKIRGTRRSRF